ncbi:MAG: futalosine hydrolase [Planctomycetes bacterium]|nr:futalosine hydrolase [Planctomycetota bacterium]
MKSRTTLLLVPTELELARLADQGGFPLFEGRVELCGFGPVAAAARTAQLLARHAPQRVLLVGIAGSFAPERLPVGSATSFAAAAIEGLGSGSGFPQWPAREGLAAIHDRLALTPATGQAPAQLLLTTYAASDSAAQVEHRLRLYPEAAAEDMEGFAVAFACALAGVPCSIVRGISNTVGDRDARNWRIPAALAAARALALAELAARGAA